jgi:hypothetical protein
MTQLEQLKALEAWYLSMLKFPIFKGEPNQIKPQTIWSRVDWIRTRIRWHTFPEMQEDLERCKAMTHRIWYLGPRAWPLERIQKVFFEEASI